MICLPVIMYIYRLTSKDMESTSWVSAYWKKWGKPTKVTIKIVSRNKIHNYTVPENGIYA